MDPPLVDKDISNEEDKTVNATTEHVEDPFNDNDHRDIHLGFEGEVLGDPFKNVSTDNSESNIHKSAISDNLINGSDFCVISKSANILPETTDLSGNQKDIVKDQLDPVGGENQDNSEAEKRKLDNLSSKSETQGEIISTDNDTSSILNEVVSASTQNFGFVKSGNLHFCGNQNVSLVANHIRERTDKIILNNSLDVDSSNQSELAACSKDIEIPGEVECEPSCEVDKGKNIEEENDQDAIKATNDVRDIVSESNCVKKNDFGNPGYVGDDDIDMSVDENEEFNEENSTIISDGNNAINKFSNVDKNAIEGKDENHSEKQLVNKGLEDSEIGKCFMDIDNGRDSNRVEVETGESRDGSISNLDTGGTSTSKLDSLEYISLNSSHDIVGDMTRDEDDDSLLGSLSFNTLSDPFKDEETDDPLNDKGFRINKEKNSTVSADESFEVFESHSEEQTSKSNAIKLNKEPTNLDNISSGVKDQGKIKTSDPVIYSEVHSKTPETEVTSDNIRSIDHDHSRLQHDCHSPIAQHNDMILVKADMSVEKVKEPENLISVNRPNSRKDANLDSGMVTISEIQQANSECHLKDPSISLATEPENMVTNSMPRTIEGVVTNEEICKELVEKPVNAENTSSLNKLNTVEDIMTTEQIHENPENALATATEDKQTNFQSELEDSSSLMVTEKENVSISNELCVDDSSKESVVIAEETAGNLPKEPVNKDEHLSFESELQSSSSSEVTKQESHGSNSKSISIEHSGITKQIPGIVGEKTPTVNKQVNSLGVETEKVAKNNESFSMEGVVTTKEVCDNSVEKTVTNNEHKRKSSERNLEAPSSLLVAESENVAANNEPDSMDDVVITGEIRSSSKPCISKIISDKSEEDNDLTISDEKTGITRGNRLICIIHGDGLLDKLDDQKVAQCVQCKMDKNVLYTITDKIRDFSVCSQSCFAQFEKSQSTPHQIKKVNMTIIDKEPLPDLSSEVGTIPFCAGKCIPCGMDIKKESNFLSWEMMDFCSILCLETYEKQFERECMFCKASIKGDQLCKFRVRFGRELKQFCSSGCLDAYKPTVKICNYCQKDMKNNSAHSCIARIGDSQTFKDFCSVVCVIKYDDLLNLEDLGRDICTVCTKTSEIHAKIDFDERTHLLCSDPCISAFTFVNQIKAEICDTCSKLVDKEKDKPYSITELTEHKKVRYFCSQGCLNRYIMRKRAIVQCESCRVRKFNFDLIRMDINNEKKLFCSIRCLRTGINKFKGRLCEVCLNSASTTLVMDQKQQLLKVCILCREKHFSQPDLLSKNRILGHGSASRTKEQLSAQGGKNFASKEVAAVLPVTSSLISPDVSHEVLVPASAPIQVPPRVSISRDVSMPAPTSVFIPPKINVEVMSRILKHRPPPKVMVNKITACKPIMKSKGQQCGSSCKDAAVQTDSSMSIIPIPVPMYVPAPMMMYSAPAPFPLPMPIPVPVPIFIPLSSRTHEEVCAYIEKIQKETPNDPVEADLIAMAAMIAEEQENENRSENGVENHNDTDTTTHDGAESSVSGEPSNTVTIMSVDASQTFKSPSQLSFNQESVSESSERDDEHIFSPDDEEETINKGKRRKSRRSNGKSKKKKKTVQSEKDETPKSKPSLKTEYGLNAWKKWVTEKNVELENLMRTGKKGLKPFKTELLSMSPEEVYASMCFFVKELKKPDGSKYAPDSIYYLCLCVQKHLNENGRIDDIFSDFYYERFSIHVNEVISEYVSARGDEAFLTSRIEEEHLWECKQLGAHSPQVLLYTLFYFNTKYLGLKTLESHKTLSYASIIKSWKKVPGGSLEGSNGSQITRLVTLKHITPNRKKEGIDGFPEMVENWENPLRCPVKLYEFYISKCPESVRMKNDIYYSCPERSCVPDSPVWYSVRNVPDDVLQRMLNRTLLVRGVNESLVELEES